MAGEVSGRAVDHPSPASSSPDANDVAAVVVTYNPDALLHERIALTMGQVGGVFIVDNGSGGNVSRMLKKIAASPKVELVFNTENLGIAAALNQGVRRALSQGYKWVLTLDQDSKPHPRMVSELTATYRNRFRSGDDALVAPVPVDELSGRAELLSLCEGREDVEVKTVLTSGSLLSDSLLASVGPFREDLFIDYVDAEHCLRARRAGHPVVLSCNARLLHNLGAPTYHRFLWKTEVVTSNHPPLRRYYITRNRFLVMKEYVLYEPSWTARELQAFVKETVKLVLFEGSKRKKVRLLLVGVVDALRNKTGKLHTPASAWEEANNGRHPGKA